MSDACGSCNDKNCADGSCGQETARDQKLNKALARIRRKIVVLSGKGGVGKSTVAANIAVALSLSGRRVGLLDVDVHGPSVPRILSLTGSRPHMEPECIEPVSWSRNLGVMSLGFLIPNKEDAVIWRGPVKMGLIRQFLEDVAWGDLDALVVDCPPGTGDEPLSVLQLLGQGTGAVIVTTPQGVAIDDVRRSVTFCHELGTPVLGILENMSGFVCPKCQETVHVFDTGGGQRLAEEMGIPFLGRLPLDPEVVRSGDQGFPFVKVHPQSPTTKALEAAVKLILTHLEAVAGRQS